MKKINHFILDYSKWRSGMFGINQVGKGPVSLLSSYGQQCCLGQFGSQCGIPNEALFNNQTPNGIDDIRYHAKNWQLSEMTMEALMELNDHSHLDIQEKLTQIASILLDNGITMEVINEPK